MERGESRSDTLYEAVAALNHPDIVTAHSVKNTEGLHFITIELVKRGYSDEDIEKIWGGNFLRVFKQVELYSHQVTAD